MLKKIDVSIDTFALIWAARVPGENNEDEIIARLARAEQPSPSLTEQTKSVPKKADREVDMSKAPKSQEWVDVLVWSLRQLGGRAHLSEIYKKARAARTTLGIGVTKHHEAAARERLESYCSDSRNYKHIADLFYMPEGKGAGVWALRSALPARYQ